MLSDEHARAIYDIFGKKGLEVEGWEVFTLSNTTLFAAESNCCYSTHTVSTCLHYLYFWQCRWWKESELQQKFERSMKDCREKEKRGGCSRELTPRFSHSQQHQTICQLHYYRCHFCVGLQFHADSNKWIVQANLVWLWLGSNLIISFIIFLLTSFLNCSGHHQCGCGCYRPVWPLWWGFWRDARRRVSSYWNQQDAHFPVHRGRTATYRAGLLVASQFNQTQLSFFRLLWRTLTQQCCLVHSLHTMEMEGATLTWPYGELPQPRAGERYAYTIRSCIWKFGTHLHAFTCFCALLSAGGVWCRGHTRTSHWVKGVPQRHPTVVRLDSLIHMNSCLSMEKFSVFISFCHLFVQLFDSPRRFAVLSSRLEAKLFPNDSTPPGPEHHGLSAVALGAQQRHDYQPGPRHKEQSLYSSSAGLDKAQAQMNQVTYNSFSLNLCLVLLISLPFPPLSAGCASLLPDDELPVQVPGWGPDES